MRRLSRAPKSRAKSREPFPTATQFPGISTPNNVAASIPARARPERTSLVVVKRTCLKREEHGFPPCRPNSKFHCHSESASAVRACPERSRRESAFVRGTRNLARKKSLRVPRPRLSVLRRDRAGMFPTPSASHNSQAPVILSAAARSARRSRRTPRLFVPPPACQGILCRELCGAGASPVGFCNQAGSAFLSHHHTISRHLHANQCSRERPRSCAP